MNPGFLFTRLKQFSIEVIYFSRSFKSFPETKIIQNQLIRSATSSAANFRAANCARSKNEWFAKISIVLEEIDESQFWLDIIKEIGLSREEEKCRTLHVEAVELTKIFSKIRKTAKTNRYSSK